MTIRGFALESGAYIEAESLAEWREAERLADSVAAQLVTLLDTPLVAVIAAVTPEQPARLVGSRGSVPAMTPAMRCLNVEVGA